MNQLLQSYYRTRLKLNVLRIILYDIFTGRISLTDLLYSLKKQMHVAKLFRNNKLVSINGKIFIDPFGPYFPSKSFDLLMRNNSIRTFPLNPNYAQISITDICPCKCVHCHVVNTQTHRLDRKIVMQTLDEMATMDFPLVFFVGGEPMSRFNDLLDFVDRATQLGMDTRIFTSGVGASAEKLASLKKAGLSGVYVSIDHQDEAIHNEKRGNPLAYKSACRTVKEAVALGYYVSVVCCVTKTMIDNGDAYKVVDLAESLGAHSIQLNEIRPVGMAAGNSAGLFLGAAEKKKLIEFFNATNSSNRKIAIAMPWYNEEPDRFGCTATSGQQVYIDVEGNIQPCVLLKTSVGNIYNESFHSAWDRFLTRCRHPVRNCIIYDLADEMNASKKLPLSPERTMARWDEISNQAPADIYAKFKLLETRKMPKRYTDSALFSEKYNLALTLNRDFFVKENHWLPRKFGAKHIAIGKTLYSNSTVNEIPKHEYLHIAQYRKYGVHGVLLRYLTYGLAHYLKHRNFGKAFANVPFEVEAREYECE